MKKKMKMWKIYDNDDNNDKDNDNRQLTNFDQKN